MARSSSSPFAPASSPPGSLPWLAASIAACRRCQEAGHLVVAEPRLLGLDRRLTEPVGRWPRVVVIGQAPGRQAGSPHHAGLSPYMRVMAGWLALAGFVADNPNQIAHFTALTRCFPGPARHGAGDRAPSRAERALCREYLDAELALIRPRVILLAGALAVATFSRQRTLTDAVGEGWEVDHVRYLALPHPSGVSRWSNAAVNRAALDRALDLLSRWRQDLALDA